MRRFVALIAIIASLFAVAGGAAAKVDQATVYVDKGAAGVALGMTRAEVIAALGQPISENSYGYMQYSDADLFDVYRSGKKNDKVDLIGVSGPNFCLRSGVCMLQDGNVAALKHKFGRKLTYHVLLDHTRCWRISGHHRGRRVFTQFDVTSRKNSARIIMIWVGYKH
jgi:hypothetical protein